jgi:hypothetical protein
VRVRNHVPDALRLPQGAVALQGLGLRHLVRAVSSGAECVNETEVGREGWMLENWGWEARRLLTGLRHLVRACGIGAGVPALKESGHAVTCIRRAGSALLRGAGCSVSRLGSLPPGSAGP